MAAPADSCAGVVAAIERVMGMRPLAPAAVVAAEETRALSVLRDPTAELVRTEVAARMTMKVTHHQAEAVATAVLAGAVAPQERTGPSSVAVGEEMVDLAVAVVSALVPTSIATALPDRAAPSEEAATAVAVAEVAVLWEAPSLMTAAQ